MKKCYIIGAGEFFGNVDPCEEDIVIAADGGLGYLTERGIIPDVLVGDFDSLQEKPSFDGAFLGEGSTRAEINESNGARGSLYKMNGKNVEIVRYPIMKDKTDMCLAYEIGAARGYREFEIYGGVGGREDHTFANYCLLLNAKNDKNNVTLVGNASKTFVIKNEKIRVCGREGATVSVFAFGGFASGVSIKGLKYEAHNVTLDPANPIGVSNSFIFSGEGEISVENGALLITIFD